MAQQTQFESDLVPWVETVRGAVEAQWRGIERLRTGLQDARNATHAARREAVTIRQDVEARLSCLEGQLDALSDLTRIDLGRIRDSGYQETRLREQLRKDLTSLSQTGKISESTFANLQQGHSDLIAWSGDHAQKIRELEKKATTATARLTEQVDALHDQVDGLISVQQVLESAVNSMQDQFHGANFDVASEPMDSQVTRTIDEKGKGPADSVLSYPPRMTSEAGAGSSEKMRTTTVVAPPESSFV